MVAYARRGGEAELVRSDPSCERVGDRRLRAPGCELRRRLEYDVAAGAHRLVGCCHHHAVLIAQREADDVRGAPTVQVLDLSRDAERRTVGVGVGKDAAFDEVQLRGGDERDWAVDAATLVPAG